MLPPIVTAGLSCAWGSTMHMPPYSMPARRVPALQCHGSVQPPLTHHAPSHPPISWQPAMVHHYRTHSFTNLPFRPCRATAGLTEKTYACRGQACKTLSTEALFQVKHRLCSDQRGCGSSPLIYNHRKRLWATWIATQHPL